MSNFLKKISLIKNVRMDQKWSHAKVLSKYFEVYGQASKITPEAREKKPPFYGFYVWITKIFDKYVLPVQFGKPFGSNPSLHSLHLSPMIILLLQVHAPVAKSHNVEFDPWPSQLQANMN